MEEELGITYYKRVKKRDGLIHETKSSHALVRYADDFVIICRTREDAENMYEKLQPYLQKRGLELAKDKTRITHITEGFNFLGFNVRKYELITGISFSSNPAKKACKKPVIKLKKSFIR